MRYPRILCLLACLSCGMTSDAGIAASSLHLFQTVGPQGLATSERELAAAEERRLAKPAEEEAARAAQPFDAYDAGSDASEPERIGARVE